MVYCYVPQGKCFHDNEKEAAYILFADSAIICARGVLCTWYNECSTLNLVSSMAADEHDDYCLKQYRYLYSPDILRGKVALITGGGSGIGFRIAEIFMRHKCDITIASRKISKLKEVRTVLHVKGMCTLSFSPDTEMTLRVDAECLRMNNQ